MTTQSIASMQEVLMEWERRTFPETTALTNLASMVEEVGEYARCVLKRTQGIRPDVSSDEKTREELGDIFVTLCTAAGGRGWSLQEIAEAGTRKVLAR